MFARKLRIEIAEGGQVRPVPKDWLDQFFMRNFVGLSAFDETLVTGDGEMETGLGVEPERVREQFEKWLRGRKLLGSGVRLRVRSR
jgi:hypothetical protein